MSDTRPATIQLCVPRTTHYLGMVRKVIAMAAERVGFPVEDVDKIELAVDEACSNAVVHGSPVGEDVLRLEVTVTEQRFVVVLRDGGAAYGFDELGNFAVEDQLSGPDMGGLGVYIIKRFMDEVTYEHTEEDGNVLTMCKRRVEG